MHSSIPAFKCILACKCKKSSFILFPTRVNPTNIRWKLSFIMDQNLYLVVSRIRLYYRDTHNNLMVSLYLTLYQYSTRYVCPPSIENKKTQKSKQYFTIWRINHNTYIRWFVPLLMGTWIVISRDRVSIMALQKYIAYMGCILFTFISSFLYGDHMRNSLIALSPDSY